MKILHLNVTAEWFDKIKSGEKTVEYREIKPYWIKRLIEPTGIITSTFKEWDIVRIKNGYGKTAPVIEKKWIKTVVSLGGDLGNFPQFGIHLEDLHGKRCNR